MDIVIASRATNQVVVLFGPSFSSRRTYSVPGAYRLDVADFNKGKLICPEVSVLTLCFSKDGFTDVVVASLTEPYVYTLLGRSSGNSPCSSLFDWFRFFFFWFFFPRFQVFWFCSSLKDESAKDCPTN